MDTKSMTDERLAELRAEVEDLDNHWTAQQAMEELIAEVDRLRADLGRSKADIKEERWRHAQTSAQLDRVMAETEWAGFR